MQKSTYKIAKMDCPSEESIVRMKLEGMEGIRALQFDIPKRKLDVIHEGKAEPITTAIDSLSFNSSFIETEEIDDDNEFLLHNTSEWADCTFGYLLFWANYSSTEIRNLTAFGF